MSFKEGSTFLHTFPVSFDTHSQVISLYLNDVDNFKPARVKVKAYLFMSLYRKKGDPMPYDPYMLCW